MNSAVNSIEATYSQSEHNEHPFAGKLDGVFDKLLNQEEKSNNSGITVPGKQTIQLHNNFNSSSCHSISESFSIVIELKESDKEIVANVKKICPTCTKKFKPSYFYCPFDGTFLDEQ